MSSLARLVPLPLVESALDVSRADDFESLELEGAVVSIAIAGGGADDLLVQSTHGGEQGVSRSARMAELMDVIVEEAIEPHGGALMRVVGDSLLAVFRGPEGSLYAVTASHAAQQVAAAYDADGGTGIFRLRIGAAAGEVRVVLMGDRPHRMPITTGRASRAAVVLQRRSEPGTTLIDESVAAALGERVSLALVERGVYALAGFERTPPPTTIASLDDLLASVTDPEPAIEFLEPIIPPVLLNRLRHLPPGWRVDPEQRDVVLVTIEIRGLRQDRMAPARGVARGMQSALRRFGGVPISGDLIPGGHRIVAAFGLQAPGENMCERAVLAALESVKVVKGIAESERETLEVRAGIHRGTVYFGSFGSANRHALTVVGGAVKLATRACSLASPNVVVATDTVTAQLRDTFDFLELERMLPRGRGDSLSLVAIHGVSDGGARFVQCRHRRQSLAGRGREIDELMSIFADARHGHGKAIGLCGEAGSGKSHILGPLIDRWIAEGGVGHIERCHYSRRSQPLAPVLAMFRNFAGILDVDREETKRERLRTAVEHLGIDGFGPDDCTELFDFVLESSTSAGGGVIGKDRPWDIIIATLQRFVEARISRMPTMYILEDLHNADELTVRFARRLLSLPRDSAYVFIGTYRPHPGLGALRRGLDREIVLEGLGLRGVGDLVAGRFGAAAVDDSVMMMLWERTRGNPQQVAELADLLRTRGALTVRGNQVVTSSVMAARVGEFVPPTMSQLALSRLEELTPIERRVARVASVTDSPFAHADLVELTSGDLSAVEVESALIGLVEKGIIRAEIGATSAYSFADGSIRSVTYTSIPELQRRELHSLVADHLEQAAEESAERHAASLARHRESAGQLRAAASWYERAVRYSAAAGLDGDTFQLAECWERVVDGLDDLDRPTSAVEAQVALLRFVATARRFTADDALEQARRISSKYWLEMSREAQSVCDLWHGAVLLAVGEIQTARARLARAYEVGRRPELRCDAALRIVSCFAEDLSEAWKWFERAAAEVGGDEPYWTDRVDLVRASLMAREGRLDEARILNARVRDRALARSHLRVAAMACSSLARCDLDSGDIEDARRGFTEALVMARALGTPIDEVIDHINLAAAELFCRMPEQAAGHLETALAISRDIGHRRCTVEAQLYLAAATVLMGDRDDGRSAFEKSVVASEGLELDWAIAAATICLLWAAVDARDEVQAWARLEDCDRLEVAKRSPLLALELHRLRAEVDRLDRERQWERPDGG